jgi:hypothetical protein
VVIREIKRMRQCFAVKDIPHFDLLCEVSRQVHQKQIALEITLPRVALRAEGVKTETCDPPAGQCIAQFLLSLTRWLLPEASQDCLGAKAKATT